MAKKTILSGAATYVRNVGKHLQRVAAREEGARDAIAGLSRDAKKLARITHKARSTPNHKRAKALAKKGREAYNTGNYQEAEQLFHEAIVEDGHYALAYLHLGNTYYQLSRFNEATAAWRRAIAADAGSDAAAKAQAKLMRVESSKERTVQDLEDRLRDR